MADAIQVPKHYVDRFRDEIFHKAQQAQIVLAGGVRKESHMYGEAVFYDSFEQTYVNKRTERAQQTKIVEVDRDRRAVYAEFYDHAQLIDSIDKAKMINDPTSALTKAYQMAFLRKMDEVIYDAALSPAFTGRNGTVQVVLPNTQKLVAHDGTATTPADLNIRTLLKVKRKFLDNNIGTGADMADGLLHIAIRPAQLEQLLGRVEVQSADYNTVRALVKGEIDTFLGMKFHIYNGIKQTEATTQFVVTDGTVGSGAGTAPIGSDRCIVWYQDGILLSQGSSMVARVDNRPDLSNATQLFAEMHIGATRMEEVKVIELICKA
jgi:hypothetical protein